eukprot:SM000056S17981  [mRNA]  locus=s56:474809:477216:- [translate_table: standard]
MEGKTRKEHPTGDVLVGDKHEADAIGFGQNEPKGKIEKFYFQHYPMEDDDLRIQITRSGVCHSDPHVMDADWPLGYVPPIIPGHEVVGRVIRRGPAVKDFHVGQRVGFGPNRNCCERCEFCLRSDDHLCVDIGHYEPKNPKRAKFLYDPNFGGYATQARPAYYAFHLPDQIDDEHVAPLLCAGVTTYNPISRYVKKGMHIAINGIGGLGHLALQWCKVFGAAKVYAISGHAQDKEALAKELGADEVVDRNNDDKMKALQQSLDFVVSTNPFDTDYDRLIELVKPGAVYCQIGIPPKEQPLHVDPFRLAGLQKTIHSVWVGSRRQTREMLNMAVKHNVRPRTELLRLDEVDKAIERMRSCKTHFRQVLDCESYAKAEGLIAQAAEE